MKIRDLVFGVGFAYILSGCTTASIISNPLSDVASGDLGITYALPKGLVEILLESDGSSITEITPAVSYQPDVYNRYNLTITENPWFSEQPTIGLTENGLLELVNADSTDQSEAIVESVVTLVTDISTIGLQADFAPSTPVPKKTKYKKRLVFDPLDPLQMAGVRNSELTGFNIKVDVLDLGSNPLHELNANFDDLELRSEQLKADAKRSADQCKKSICFRVVVPLILRLSISAAGVTTAVYDFSISVPDPRLVAGLDITRAPCVRKTDKLTLKKGVLTKYEKDLPSVVLGCLGIPSKIVAGILGFPIAQNNRRVALLESEIGLLEKQTALIEAQQKLIDAQQKDAKGS